MLIDPAVVGSTSEATTIEVEKGAIRAFAHAIGDDNPLCTDEAFARQHGYASLVAPPTFPTTFRVPIPNVRFELSRVLHGGQEYSYERPIVAGDVLRCVSRVADVYEREGKQGGKMTFLVTEVRGEDLGGRLVYTSKSTTILR
ncbi:MaoC family dehydratase N-terminal domain-containing protein [Brevibacillus choshinensis]|uniref:MaoC family dehydratase N-terminal domain-containing protein n=1 Tax=Brevibacillus choshinensis TaxID=54911 RepID=UPI002E1E0332|nr:MaoC family dehydratase N-terminal domain-containing protein [Brevibacillus choshinensis]MED4753801.1 MaoC family dehydratase N-terminal domain-containing protein [Brevibacillus choshinensis]MED4781767.1 MaoC family dehydratase N-terminal domain-containing protein [Brevibacillus choshinensis]